MKRLTAIALFVLIAVSVAVMWDTQKWVTSIPETGAFLLVALWGLAFLRRSETPRFSIVMLPFVGVIVWALIQLAAGITVYPHITWLSILYWSGNLATLFVSVQIFTDSDLRKSFFRWLTIFGFVVSVQAALQALTVSNRIYWIFPTEFAGWNLLGPFVYHNQFAAFVELLLPIVLYNVISDTTWRAFDILIAGTMYAAVIVSASRTGFALVTIELILVPLMVLGRRRLASRRALGAAATMGAIVVLLGISAGPENVMGRFGIKDPYVGRREFVYSSITMFKEKPLMGVGLGNWPTAYPHYALYDNGTFANQAHNDWAQWAVEGGLPLLLLQLCAAVWIFPRAIRSAWGLGVASVYLHCFVDYPIQRPANALVFFAIFGAIVAHLTERRQTRRLQLVRT
jgi:O-antigen ligase